jgi:hypothetical protein
MKTFVLSALGLSALAIGLLAQPAPQPSELQRLKLLNSYQRAVLLQQQAQSAQQQFDAARTDYTKLADDVSAEMKLPKGSQFIIDVAKQQVTVQLPPIEPKNLDASPPAAAPAPAESQPSPPPAQEPK